MSKSKRWKPKEGEEYWFITDVREGVEDVMKWQWVDVYADKALFRLGNCFQTKKEAEVVARKLKGFWKDVREGR